MSRIWLCCFLIFQSVYCWSQNLPGMQPQKLLGIETPNLSPLPRMQSVNGCNTWTFQTYLRPTLIPGFWDWPFDVLPLSNSNYIITGGEGASFGPPRGMLYKLNSKGELLFTKKLSIGTFCEIQKIREFSNGKLYALATLATPDPYTRNPVLLVLDSANLNVLNVFKMDADNGPVIWSGVDLAEGNNNACYIFSSSDSLLNITKLNGTSFLTTWSKTYKPRNAPRAVALGIEQNYVYASWNETDSGYRKGVIMALDSLGNYKYGSRVGGAADGFNIEMQSMTIVNLRPRITGLQSKNNQFQSIRLNFEPTLVSFFRDVYSINGLNPSANTIVRQNGFSEVIAHEQDGSSSDIFLTNTFPDNYQDGIRTWKLHFNTPVRLVRVVRTLDGGSLVMSHEEIFPFRTILTKTDSIASLPGCGSLFTASSFQRVAQVFKMDTIPSKLLVMQFTIPPVLAPTFGAFQTFDCQTPFCPAPPHPDSCLRTFFKEYRNYTNSMVTRNHANMGAGKFLVLGSSRVTPYIAEEHAQLTVIDTMGKLLDSKILQAAQMISLYTLDKLSDGNLLATGTLRNGSNPYDIYLIKFTDQFSIIWQKKLTTLSPPDFNAIDAVLETSDGDIYCYLKDRITLSSETRTLLKLNASGNPVWMQQYSIGPTIFPGSSEFIPDLVEMGDGVILKYNDEAGDYSPYLMRVKKSDGSVDWVRKYQMPPPHNGSNSFTLTKLISDGTNLYMSGRSQERNVLLKIRPDGSVALAKQSSSNSISLGWMGLKPGGRLITSVGAYNVGGYVNGVVELDTSFSILRTQYMQVPKSGRNSSLIVYSDSVTYASGSLWYGNSYWASMYFQKYNFNSSFASCEVNEQLLDFNSFLQTTSTRIINRVSLTVPQMLPYNASFVEEALFYSGYYCGNNSNCSTLDLQGPLLICDTTNIYDFPVVRNAGCDGMVLWKLDTLPGQLKIISSTDNLLRIKMRSGGSFQIHAKMYANCGWLEDSIMVQATTGNGLLELGQSLTICPGNSVLINAHTGFGSYLWQDGSTDSVLIVTQPGLYHVQVTSCGNILKDSVQVFAAASIPFDLGPDRTKCNSDTVQLSAPPGFINYTWSNNYNINSTTAQNVVVNPLVDTAYYVRGEKTPGCFAWDTIRVNVRQSPPIQLGADLSFCLGDSASFNAGNGFLQYQWSNGPQTQQITVKSAGNYSVIGITVDGCKSFDTVKVLNVFQLPQVNLDQDAFICAGTGKTLSAGSFISYVWSTGAVTPSIVVNNVGQYAVTVTDANGCKASDTTAISTILPLPSGFLPADTMICSFATLMIKPVQNFQQYFWNTGSNNSSITVSQPGLYWLEVADANNCKGRDSIVVDPQDCLKGFYIPTAFTPNGDQRNDDFKPVLMGAVKKYLFTIYNRWGQVIFQSSEIGKGWNGKLNGLALRSDVFVWTCSYQFEGGQEKMEKGTFVLIR